MKEKKLINICSAARSGSTMLDLILGNDNRVFSLGEIYAWFRPHRKHHFKIKCTCKNENCPWDRLKEITEAEFYKTCFQLLDVDVLVDSSKNIPWVKDNNLCASQDKIKVYNILLYKEPVSFMYSFWKRGISINKARKNIFIKYYNRFFETQLPFVSLNYNKLVADPQSVLKKLCQVLDIPYFDGKERFWEKEHHHLFGSLGTRKQLSSPNPGIRKTEGYPDEFKAMIPEIEADNLNNKAFQRVIKKLQKNELRLNATSTDRILKPYWYYMSKLKQTFRKRFPE